MSDFANITSRRMDIVAQLRACGDGISNHAADEIERLRAKVPRTADGVEVEIGMEVWDVTLTHLRRHEVIGWTFDGNAYVKNVGKWWLQFATHYSPASACYFNRPNKSETVQ